MHPLRDWRKPPNMISVFRGVLGLLFASLGIYGTFRLSLGKSLPSLPLPWLQIAIIFGVVSDKLDGTLARRFDWMTDLGKDLERYVDGLFIVSVIVFETIYLRFPGYLMELVLWCLCVGLSVILCSRVFLHRWFIDDYISTKFAPGYGYLLVVLHVFDFRQIAWFDWFGVGVAIFALADFLWRFRHWLHANQTRPSEHLSPLGQVRN